MVEILYYDICNLYGDYGNIEYLEKCFGRKNIIYTNISEKPYFLNNTIDFNKYYRTREYYHYIKLPSKEYLKLLKNLFKPCLFILARDICSI